MSLFLSAGFVPLSSIGFFELVKLIGDTIEKFVVGFLGEFMRSAFVFSDLEYNSSVIVFVLSSIALSLSSISINSTVTLWL